MNNLLGDSVILKVKTTENDELIFNSFVSASKYFNIKLSTFKRKLKSDIMYLGYDWNITRI